MKFGRFLQLVVCLLLATGAIDGFKTASLTSSLTASTRFNTCLRVDKAPSCKVKETLEQKSESDFIDHRCVSLPNIPSTRDTDRRDGSYQVLQYWLQIRKKGSLKHLADKDCQLLKQALSIVHNTLLNQLCDRSMEKLMDRAVGTAAVLGELRADKTVVLAGLLQDVVINIDRTSSAYKNLSQIFGVEVIRLAESYARLPNHLAQKLSYTDTQSEDQQQLIVVHVEDYRTLYIRLAARLHTMRMLRKLPLDETGRRQIALEARHVYAPLAHKMGLMWVHSDMEDLAFSVLEPSIFEQTRSMQKFAEKTFFDALVMVHEVVNTDPLLSQKGVFVKFSHRIKSKYQIYRKLLRKDLTNLSDVRDTLGLRLIIDCRRYPADSDEGHAERQTALCYHVLQRLRQMDGWKVTPNGYKDYIKHPKQNGYQSLHQYICRSARGAQVEVQVRTREMHVQAELGEAAHWWYKDRIYRPEVAASKTYQRVWRSKQQLSARSAADLFRMAKNQLLHSRVFAFFGDKSNVVGLQKGATALDALFTVQVNQGFTTKEVCVNNKVVPLSQVICMGDVISVQSKNNGAQDVNPEKLKQVRTSYAVNALRSHFAQREQSKFICRGLIKFLFSYELNAHEHNVTYDNADHLCEQIRTATNQSTVGNFFFTLGYDTNDCTRLLSCLFRLPQTEVLVVPFETAQLWVRMQNTQLGAGWENQHMFCKVVLPLLREVLPQQIVQPKATIDEGDSAHFERSLEECWCELAGPLPQNTLSSPARDAPAIAPGAFQVAKALARAVSKAIVTECRKCKDKKCAIDHETLMHQLVISCTKKANVSATDKCIEQSQ